MTRHDRPNRRPQSPPRNGLFFLGILLALLAVGAAWYAFHPTDLARLVGRIRPVPPSVTFLQLSVNGRTREIKPGQFLQFHPNDEFAIQDFESNRWVNYDLRLYSPDLDVEVLKKPHTLFNLLGEKEFYQPKQLVIQVKEFDRVIADFYLLVSMTALDWAAKADTAEKPEEKAFYYRLAMSLEPKNELLRDKLAGFLVESGDYDGAADVYEKSMGKTDQPEILNKILDIYRAAKNSAKTIATYQRLIKVVPEDQAVALLNELAALQVTRGLLDDAIRSYESLLKKTTPADQPEVLKQILAVYQKARNHGQVTATYQRLIKASPPNEAISYLRQLADLHEKKGEIQKTLEVLNELQARLPRDQRAPVLKKMGFLQATHDKLDQAVKSYEAAAEADPKDRNVFLNLARLYRSGGNLAKCAENLAKVLELDENDHDIRVQLAETLLESGAQDQAEIQYHKLLEQNPADRESRLRLAQLLEKRGDTKELSIQYAYLLQDDPQNAVLLYNLGVIYYEAKELDKAETMMDRAIAVDPQDAGAWQYLFEIRRALGKTKEAVQAAVELLKLKPDMDNLYSYVTADYETRKDYQGLAQLARQWMEAQPGNPAHGLLLATTLENQGRLDEAAAVYQTMVESKPDDPALLAKLAELYEKAGQEQKAAETYQAMVKLKPGDAGLHLKLAEYYEKNGQKAAAMDMYQRVAELSPKNVEVRLKLAGWYEKSGRRQEAKDMYDKILAMSPNNRAAAEGRLRLRLEELEDKKSL